MLLINKSSLIVVLAIVVVFTAVAVGIVLSQIFFRITYVSEFELSKNKIGQLYNTVSPTASIAAYLEDEELINEVLVGLKSNDIVESAAIKTDIVVIESKGHVTNENSLSFTLSSPFEKDRKVGSMVITPNINQIEAKAKSISWDNIKAILAQAAVVTLAVIVVSYVIVTSPISLMAKKLHIITPGTDERLKLPRYHTKSELGILVSDINLLLDRSSKQISEERQLRQQVEKLSHHFQLLFESSTSPIVLTEPNGNIVLYNRAFIDLLDNLGLKVHQSFGRYLRELFEDVRLLDSTIEEALNNGEFASGEFKLKSANSNEYWVQAVVSSTVTDDYQEYYQIALHDISLRRQQLEQLNLKAYTDKLTGLLNRRGAERQIQPLVEQGSKFALLLVDLNRFKPINDVYGHDVGDLVLHHVSSQLTKCMQKQDILARWGGDEFVIVLPAQDVEHVKQTASNIKQHIEKPLFIESLGANVSVGASIGASFFPNESLELALLIKSADQAMYSLKAKRESGEYLAFSSDVKLG